MLRESLRADRPKGSGNLNGPSGPSIYPRSFSQIVTRKKTYVTMIVGGYGTCTWWRYEKTTKGCLREKDD